MTHSVRPSLSLLSGVALSLIVALAAPGCSGCGEDQCASNGDCASGQICNADGACVDGGGGSGGAGGGSGLGGSSCPSAVECGVPPVCCAPSEECVLLQCLPICETERCGADQSLCCAAGEECFQDQCLPLCPAPQERCGDVDIQCCAAGDICFAEACTTPGGDCVDFTDCEPDEYCEPTLGQCLPITALPECEYHPPVGVFSPAVEWAFGPETAPYERATSVSGFTDICAGAGTPIAFADDDEDVVSIPFGGPTIPFFDANRSGMTVSTNGWLTLQSGYGGGAEPNNQSLPDNLAPNLVVAPYWDDLTAVSACSLIDAANNEVRVQWTGTVAGSGETLTFQAIMRANGHADAGDIEFIYSILGATQDGDGATVGLEDNATGSGVMHSHNRSGALSINETVLFRYVPLRNHVDVVAPPAVFDLDFDGRPEVIFAPNDEAITTYSGIPDQAPAGLHSGVLTILNGEDGSIQRRVEGTDLYLGAGSAISIGDIDNDGSPDLVGVGRMNPTASTTAFIKAFDADGNLKWISDSDVGFNYNGWGGGAHIADLDADGVPEIFFALHVFDNLGQLLWSEPQEYGSPTTTAADLDGDGDLELISDRSAWHHDHTLMWSRPDLGSYHFPAVADFNNDGQPEVVLVGAGSVIILRGLDGSDFWGPQSIGTSGGGPLNIGDFDADGFAEIGTAGASQYVVVDLQCVDPLPPDCASLGIRWTTPSKDQSSEVTGSSLFDFEGDGSSEVIYSDECFTRVYSGFDGTVLFETPNNTRTATEYPLVADVDGDHNAEIIVVANEYTLGCTSAPWNTGLLGTPWTEAPYHSKYCTAATCGRRGLFVYGDVLDNWVPTRRVWSGHAYHITNITGGGAIPAPEKDNWLLYNNFRMNAQGADVFNAPDLVVELEVDPSACDEQLILRATVGNEGAIGVLAGVQVSFFKGDGQGGWICLGSEQTSDDLLPGASTEVVFNYTLLPGEQGTSLDFRVVVDSDCAGAGAHNECENGGEDNNEAIGDGQCGDPG